MQAKMCVQVIYRSESPVTILLSAHKVPSLEVCFNVSLQLVPGVEGPVTVFIVAFVWSDSIVG